MFGVSCHDEPPHLMCVCVSDVIARHVNVRLSRFQFSLIEMQRIVVISGLRARARVRSHVQCGWFDFSIGQFSNRK